MEFTAAKRNIDIKFDFKTMFKIDDELKTVPSPETGERNADGVGALFFNILERNESAIVDLVRLSAGSGKKALTEDEILDAIAEAVDEGTTEGLFAEIEKEMVDSGFFRAKILKYIENMEKSARYLKAKDDTDATQIQIIKEA